jgi:RNA polymerase sigma-70 factor (ECF subfamily)
MDDVERLAAAAARGSAHALAQLYDTYSPQVYRLIYRQLQDQAAADDVHQEVWCRVARKIGSYKREGAGFPAWLYRITHHLIRDHWRALRRRREQLTADMLALYLPAPGDTPEDLAQRTEIAEKLAAALRRLPARQCEAVTLRYWVGMTIAETAAVMGRSEGAVKQLVYRGIAKLNRALGPEASLLLEGRGRDLRRLRTVNTQPASPTPGTIAR